MGKGGLEVDLAYSAKATDARRKHWHQLLTMTQRSIWGTHSTCLQKLGIGPL